MGYKNCKTIITLTARQIAELALLHGFELDVDSHNEDELDYSEYTIITCPDSGVRDEATGETYHTTYCAYPDATFGDGECILLPDPPS